MTTTRTLAIGRAYVGQTCAEVDSTAPFCDRVAHQGARLLVVALAHRPNLQHLNLVNTQALAAKELQLIRMHKGKHLVVNGVEDDGELIEMLIGAVTLLKRGIGEVQAELAFQWVRRSPRRAKVALPIAPWPMRHGGRRHKGDGLLVRPVRERDGGRALAVRRQVRAHLVDVKGVERYVVTAKH